MNLHQDRFFFHWMVSTNCALVAFVLCHHNLTASDILLILFCKKNHLDSVSSDLSHLFSSSICLMTTGQLHSHHMMKTLEWLDFQLVHPQVSRVRDPLLFAYRRRTVLSWECCSLPLTLHSHIPWCGGWGMVRMLFFDLSSGFNTINPSLLHETPWLWTPTLCAEYQNIWPTGFSLYKLGL